MNIYIGFETDQEADNFFSQIESGEKEIPRTGYVNILFLQRELGENCAIMQIELSSDARLDHEVQSNDKICTYRASDVISINKYTGKLGE